MFSPEQVNALSASSASSSTEASGFGSFLCCFDYLEAMIKIKP